MISSYPDAVADHRWDRCACCKISIHNDLPTKIVSMSEHIELPKLASVERPLGDVLVDATDALAHVCIRGCIDDASVPTLFIAA